MKSGWNHEKNKYVSTRFYNIINDYPDVGYHKDALEYIQLCHMEINKETLEEEEEEEQQENSQNDQENDQGEE